MMLVGCDNADTSDDTTATATDADTSADGESSDDSTARLDTPDKPYAVTDSAEWVPAPPDDDPVLVGGLTRDCAGAFRTEETWFEINTGVCRLGSFTQPLLANVNRGDTLRVRLRHLGLQAAAPATAKVRLWIDGVAVWTVESPIPAPAKFWDETFSLLQPAPIGTSIHLSVENHGANSWRLEPIEVVE